MLFTLTHASPEAVESKVTFDPRARTFEVCGTWTFDAPGPASFRLAEGVHVELDAPSHGAGGVLVPEGRRVAFRTWGVADRDRDNFVGPDALVLNGVTFQFYPRFAGTVETVTRIVAPEGWIVRATGDAREGDFFAPTSRWFLVAGRAGGHVLARDGFEVIVSNPDAAPPFIDAVERITKLLEGWYGARPSRTLTVMEVPYDGGFSGIGLVILHRGAVEAFRDGDREGAFLAHEIAHQWFGGVLNTTDPIREGLATYTALRYERSQSPERGSAYLRELLELETRARPGTTIGEVRREGGWRDYEAVAYARSALAFDRLRASIGDDRFDALLAYWVGTASVTAAMSFDELLYPLQDIAPDFSTDAFVADKVNADWDPRTNTTRREVSTISGTIAAVVVLVAFLLARRFLPLEIVAAAGTAVWLFTLPWVVAWPVILGAAVVVGGHLLPDGYRGWAVVGYAVAAAAWFA